VAQVAAHRDQFQALETDVVLISFMDRQFADLWRREMGVNFTMLIDRDRKVYTAYGLQRSFWRSWGLKNLWYYARALLHGQALKRPQDDSTQLGGDFLVDKNGFLRLVYASKDPTDRPDVAYLLDVLRK
jgi:alkyl hydroperoxide reductase subunit AhpC